MLRERRKHYSILILILSIKEICNVSKRLFFMNPNLDYKLFFEVIQGNYLIMKSDLTIISANDAYLKTTKTVLEKISGQKLFEVFNHFDHNDADKKITKLITQAVDTMIKEKIGVTMKTFLYHLPKTGTENTEYEEKFWSATFIPIIKNDKVIFIINHIVDVTSQYHTDKDYIEKIEQNRILHSAMIGRELRMISLKEENEKLKKDLKNGRK